MLVPEVNDVSSQRWKRRRRRWSQRWWQTKVTIWTRQWYAYNIPCHTRKRPGKRPVSLEDKEERILKVTKKSGNRRRCRKLSLFSSHVKLFLFLVLHASLQAHDATEVLDRCQVHASLQALSWDHTRERFFRELIKDLWLFCPNLTDSSPLLQKFPEEFVNKRWACKIATKTVCLQD